MVNIESAAHGKQVRYHFRVFKREVCRMVTAKAAAGNSYFAHTGFVHGPGGKLFHQHFIIPGIIAGAIGRVDAFVVPAAVVNGIGAVYFHQAFVNKPALRSLSAQNLYFDDSGL
jgi:hypothetical protein